MMQAAYLDPSSLSLWFDASYFGQGEHGRDIQTAFQQVVHQDLSGLDATLRRIGDPRALARALHLVSTVWHEHRHFADLILTNYGAFRVRQFFAAYVNQGSLVSGALQANRRMAMPFDVYADPVRSSALGVESWHPDALEVAADLVKRRGEMEYDRLLLPTDLGPIDVSGDAQLEALAFIAQFGALQELVGLKACQMAQEDLGQDRRQNLRYRWAVLLARRFGILPTLDEASPQQVVDVSLLSAILVAGLLCRRWPGTASDDGGEAAYPSQRLLVLMRELRGQFTKPFSMRTKDTWGLVDAVATRLWGRSLVDELRTDYAGEARLMGIIDARTSVPPWIKSALADFHRLRGELIEAFVENPDLIVDPMTFARELLPHLQPMPVLVNRAGHVGAVPATWVRAFGYREPGSTREDATWWWAACPEAWPSGNGFSLTDLDAWREIIEMHGPLAKLMFNGRRHRTMLGPELVHVEQKLKQFGLELIFEPGFDYPKDAEDIGALYRLIDAATMTCDFCRTPVPHPTGHLLSPWLFRRNARNAAMIIRAYGGGDAGYLKFLRDWSPWVACDACFASVGQQLLAGAAH